MQKAKCVKWLKIFVAQSPLTGHDKILKDEKHFAAHTVGEIHLEKTVGEIHLVHGAACSTRLIFKISQAVCAKCAR